MVGSFPTFSESLKQCQVCEFMSLFLLGFSLPLDSSFSENIKKTGLPSSLSSVSPFFCFSLSHPPFHPASLSPRESPLPSRSGRDRVEPTEVGGPSPVYAPPSGRADVRGHPVRLLESGKVTARLPCVSVTS